VKPKYVIFKEIIKFLPFPEANVQYPTRIEVTPSGLDTILPLQLTIFFDVLLTVHLSIILVINQLNPQNLVL